MELLSTIVSPNWERKRAISIRTVSLVRIIPSLCIRKFLKISAPTSSVSSAILWLSSSRRVPSASIWVLASKRVRCEPVSSSEKVAEELNEGEPSRSARAVVACDSF